MRGAWLLGAVLLVPVVMLGGCKSRYVMATVHNESGAAVSVVEVDYPSASFGKELLAAGAEYHYRFKVQGSGPLKVMWTDAAEHDHTVAGPELHEGDEGSMDVTIAGGTATWALHVTGH